MARDQKTRLLKIIEAAGKKKEAELKLKNEIVKLKAASKLRIQEHGAKQRMKAAGTPDQQYLQRRYFEENPIARMAIPEEGNDSNEIEFPADEVVPSRRGGYENRPLNEDRKNQLFLSKLDQMIQAAKRGEGKMPSPLAMKVGEKMKERMNQRLGYGKTAEKAPNGRPSANTNRAIRKVTELMDAGDIKTSKDLSAWVHHHYDKLQMEGVDTDYVESLGRQILPTEYEDKKNVFGREFMSAPDRKKVGGVWYKKAQGGWILDDAENELVDEEEDEAA